MRRKTILIVGAAVVVLSAVAWCLWSRPVDLEASTRAFWSAVESGKPYDGPLLIGERPATSEATKAALSALHEIAGPIRIAGLSPAYRFPDRQGFWVTAMLRGKRFGFPTEGYVVDGKGTASFERSLLACIGLRRQQPGERREASSSEYAAIQMEGFLPRLQAIPTGHLRFDNNSFASWDEVIQHFRERADAIEGGPTPNP